MSKSMTNYNERLDEILERYSRGADVYFDVSIRYGRTRNETKQAITSLIKELVEEAKPVAHIDVYTYSNAQTYGDIRKIAIDEFEQNLLKAFEEV